MQTRASLFTGQGDLCRLKRPARRCSSVYVIRPRNTYNGAFAQDNWKISKNLSLSLGVRWDYDNQFPNKTNFAPRLGFAWSITPKTVLAAGWGLYYDHFRLGLARDIPGFGGANLVTQTFLSFPRLFYGDPSTLTILFAQIGLPVPCAASNLTDAQIAAMDRTCAAQFSNGTNKPLYGIDHLNSVVAPGQQTSMAWILPRVAITLRRLPSLTWMCALPSASISENAPSSSPTWSSLICSTAVIPRRSMGFRPKRIPTPTLRNLAKYCRSFPDAKGK